MMNGNNNYELMLEHVSGAMAIDMFGSITFISEKTANRLNSSKEDVVGKKVKEVVPHTKMMEGLRIKNPEAIFYNGPEGISICIQTPLYKNGIQVGLLEYDAVRGSELQNDFTDSYILFLEEEISHLKHELRSIHGTKYSIETISGISPAVLKLKEDIKAAAKSNYPVLIVGEGGTGKELAANAIHNLSERQNKQFVKIDYADFDPDAAESELFGHETMTGISAVKDVRKGKFEIANGATLFIDNIQRFPYALQEKIYKVLQKGEITRVGSYKPIGIDVKIVAATDQDLRELVKEGRFHEELLKKLTAMELYTPALRSRLEDLPALTDHLVGWINKDLGTKVTNINPVVLEEFKQYPWPGNVRELHDVIEQAVRNAESGRLELEDFEFRNGIFGSKSYTLYDADVDHNLIEEAKRKAEREMITMALKKFNNNKSKTAEFLEIARPLLYQKMERLGIKR